MIIFIAGQSINLVNKCPSQLPRPQRNVFTLLHLSDQQSKTEKYAVGLHDMRKICDVQ